MFLYYFLIYVTIGIIIALAKEIKDGSIRTNYLNSHVDNLYLKLGLEDVDITEKKRVFRFAKIVLILFSIFLWPIAYIKIE